MGNTTHLSSRNSTTRMTTRSAAAKSVLQASKGSLADTRGPRRRRVQITRNKDASKARIRSTPGYTGVRVQPARAVKSRTNPDASIHLQNDATATRESSAIDIPHHQPNAGSEFEVLFADVEPDLSLENEGLECMLVSYDARFNSKGESVLLQTGSRSELEIEVDPSAPAALVLTRYFDMDKNLELTRLKIQSPFIKRALRDVIGQYPSVNINSSRGVLISNAPKCLFHYQDELRTYAEESDVPEMYRHVSFTLRYMFRSLRQEIIAYNNTMNSNVLSPGLEFDHLWMAFRPGDLIYTTAEEAEVLYRLIDMVSVKSDKKIVGWDLTCEYIHNDGKYLGWQKKQTARIDRYDGYKPLKELSAYPLRYHVDESRVRKCLVARGKKYMSLVGIHHVMYRGQAELYAHGTTYEKLNAGTDSLFATSISLTRLQARHRIMIDAQEFHLNEEAGLGSLPLLKRLPDVSNPTDDQYMLCYSHIPGFDLTLKRWGWFDAASITDVNYNVAAFQALVLPFEKKEMIRSIVNEREQAESSGFDDLIEGKGKGLIMLLHGPPGVGKTYTAESIAEYSHRPLYQVNCGDLGHSSRAIEKQLDRVLTLAAKWGAVVLVDEADVFLAERQTDNLEQSGLVSVLLRTLEYFQGILFLATNKVAVLDSAVKSRMHFSISYPDLDFESRKQMWRVFAIKAANGQEPEWLDENFLATVARIPINGREIKNAARVAHAVALNRKRDLVPEDIISTLEALTSFDADFREHTSQRIPAKEAALVDSVVATNSKRKADGKAIVAERALRKRNKCHPK